MSVFTAYEAAESLKVHYNTILRMIYDGTIKAVKVRNSWRITEEELLRVLTQK